jgi:hypothetical protein
MAIFSGLLLTALVTMQVYAAPNAEIGASITDVKSEGGALHFNLNVDVGTPTETYSSLDFSLVSAEPEHLYIEKDPENDSEKNLKITFPEQYGNAYHKGRLDDNGAMRHLIGIFSQSGQNDIDSETEICSISMVYDGDAPVLLSLEGLQLVYIDDGGAVSSAKVDSEWRQEIDGNLLVTIGENETPLGALFAPGGMNVVLVAALSALLGALIAVGIFMIIRRRKSRISS